MLVTLWSALDQLDRDQATVVILDTGLEPRTVERMRHSLAAHARCAACDVLAPDAAELAQFPDSDRYGLGTWARLLLPATRPDLDRVIYLDADTLVRRSVRPLWEAGGDAIVAAVRDYKLPTVDLGLPGTYVSLGLAGTTPYFNAGVMRIDLDRWRQHDVTARCIDYLKRFGSTVRFADQDAINAVLAPQIAEVPPSWNVQTNPLHALGSGADHPFRSELARHASQLKREAHVVHFVGRKPWQPEGLRASRWSIALHAHFARTVVRSGFLTGRESAAEFGRWTRGFALRAARSLKRH